LPGPQQNRPGIERDADARRERLEDALHIPARRFLALPSSRIEALMNVPVTMQQSYCDKRQSEIGGGSHRIAGQHAEAPGIRRNLGIDADLHREIGNHPRLRSDAVLPLVLLLLHHERHQFALLGG
jgi:hypothetical protein